MQIAHQVDEMFKRQVKTWPLAATNYTALAQVETKKLTINGFDFVVQFNPARITSTAAQIDTQTIQERRCFLCLHHLPPEQEVLPFTAQSGHQYSVLCNPYPIFPHHLTIPDVNHTDQRISGRIDDMLELADLLPDFVLLYNGPKSGASAPDHFHFQAGNKGFLPIQILIDSDRSTQGYPLSFTHFQSENPGSITCGIQDPEPMLNLLCWKSHNKYHLILFPRKLHRPSQYYATGDAHILLSPGTIDLGGVLITPLQKDFNKLSVEDVTDIFKQIS
ncbi:MAG: DUF4922 domain-containing protein [Prevotellaceae bacterium]|jgi:hypothetical protein|nr:DUF4922 domain-containing protein [Prevotellaceae bacterium]